MGTNNVKSSAKNKSEKKIIRHTYYHLPLTETLTVLSQGKHASILIRRPVWIRIMANIFITVFISFIKVTLWFVIRISDIGRFKAEHECTHGWPGSIPMDISHSKCYTWICAGFSHRVTQSCESKTHGFSSTCGSTGTWKYLQVLRILNTNKMVNFKCKYMWHKIILRHGVTPWQNQIWLNRPRASYPSIALSSHSLRVPLPSHFKTL